MYWLGLACPDWVFCVPVYVRGVAISSLGNLVCFDSGVQSQRVWQVKYFLFTNSIYVVYLCSVALEMYPIKIRHSLHSVPSRIKWGEEKEEHHIWVFKVCCPVLSNIHAPKLIQLLDAEVVGLHVCVLERDVAVYVRILITVSHTARFLALAFKSFPDIVRNEIFYSAVRIL